MKHLLSVICFLLSVLCLASCVPQDEPQQTTTNGSSMQILPPYAEPCLDWHVDYKGLINYMAQRGFASTRVTDLHLYYDYHTATELMETAVLTLDSAQNYLGAEITVHSYSVSRTDISKYLSQQYVQTGATQYPSPETFYRSKTAADSILVSLRTENGRPVITYTKGVN